MADPMTLSMSTEIATIVAKKAVDVVGDTARQAVGRLVARVRERLAGHPWAETVLAEAEVEPDSAERIRVLAEVLRDAAADDPGFGKELTEFLREIHIRVSADHDGVANSFTGNAQTVIQARDIHGGMTIN